MLITITGWNLHVSSHTLNQSCSRNLERQNGSRQLAAADTSDTAIVYYYSILVFVILVPDFTFAIAIVLA